MSEIIVQYVLIVLLVVGLAYLVYLLKDKGIEIKEDYFGLAYAILNTLRSDEATSENVKKILRIISEAVKYVEFNYKNESNVMKEDEALKFARETLNSMGFESPIDENSLRYLIRIGATMLPPTHSDEKEEKVEE